MRVALRLALFAALTSPCLAQQSSTTTGLPADPHAILDAARPFYDFRSTELKPWHIKVNYQLYDEKENPTEQGTYEYWWAAPSTHRKSWTRGSASYSRWQIAFDSAIEGSVEMLSYPESLLDRALFSPLPSEKTAGSANTQLEKRSYGNAPNNLVCVMVGPKMTEVSTAPMGLFPTYCFAPSQPAIMAYFGYTTPLVEFNKIAKVQGRYLAREITIRSADRKKLLTATVDSVNGITAQDPALTPPADANIFRAPVRKADVEINPDGTAKPARVKIIQIPDKVANGMTLKRQTPIYPEDAKRARISGTVVIEAVIGTDGWVHDMRVTQAPSASLAASALGAVSQWRYKPYLLNGEPVEVDTTVNVVYALN